MVCSRRSLNCFLSIYLFFTLTNGFTYVTACQILSGPRVTTWGDWGKFDDCPHNSFVIGFRLKTEQPQGALKWQDDTALNGIAFRCRFLGHSTIKEITSSVGNWGRWGRTFDCENGKYAVGFQLRAESSQGIPDDDTAANNLRIVCSNGYSHSTMPLLEGDGLSWGNWAGDLKVCPIGMAMCGIKTRVESSQGKGWAVEGDDTALNDLDVMCCEIARATQCAALSNQMARRRRRKREDLLRATDGVANLTKSFTKLNRTKRYSHDYMKSTYCGDIEWHDEHQLNNIGQSPIKYVGYKTVARADSTASINVVTRIIASNPWPVPCTRTNFAGSKWANVMNGLGARSNDERGHLIASQFCGPAEWYNLAPQTPEVNRNVGRTNMRGFGWKSAEDFVARFIKQGCGKATITVFLNYARRSSTRPKGFKYCYELEFEDGNILFGSHYFENGEPDQWSDDSDPRQDLR